MDLELVTNEVFKRLIEKINQYQTEVEAISGKKFLQCDGTAVTIPGYEAVFLEAIKDNNDFLGYEFLVISKLSIDEMAASVNGVAINGKTRALRQFLLTGKNVYVIEEGLEYRMYKAIANPVFYNVFRDHEKQLELCGVRIMSIVALESSLISEGKAALPEVAKKEIREESTATVIKPVAKCSTVKKLINFELAKQLAVEPNIVLKTGTLVTPYANDVFRESNTTITYI
ncbi:hypothetical protein [Acetobacterium bakii]|uniref:Ethanolamine utilization protein n=1 Tax=Acetobacterium bakii TaxID=52689 RepID=A0A0L6U1V9_9FIRM|nr:hypothetical protein [Acetobacterium bakii]KNZ42494.1 hypothetical protein AKG39_06100 [Acetobacterium bakii]